MQTTFLHNSRQIRLDTAIPTTPGPHPAVLLLHGSGGNTGFWFDRIAPIVTRLNLAVFAVHYFDSTGDAFAQPSQLADGLHVPQWLATARAALQHIAENPAVDAGRIGLLGISLGAFMSLALGTESGEGIPRISAIVDISGGLIEPWASRATSRFPPTLILHGDVDTVVPVENALTLAARLSHLDVAHQLRTLPHEGHWFSPHAQLQLLGAIAPFLGKHL